MPRFTPIWQSLIKGSYDQLTNIKENRMAEQDSVTEDEEELFERSLTSQVPGVL